MGERSGKHECCRTPAEGPRDHVATDGSLLGVAGKWCACGWSVVPLDRDEEMLPIRGMYGTLDADLDVQRTIKRAELTLFFSADGGRRDVFLFNFGTATNVRFDGLRGISLRAGVPCS